MKKIIILLLILTTFCGCTSNRIITNKETESTTVIAKSNNEEIRSVWLAYYELQEFTESSKTENEFKKCIKKVFKNIKSIGFNTVTVQVRACADAFYDSKYFPVSKYVFGKEGSELTYDPLKVMVEVAHEKGLKIEAWINPYRVSQSNKIDELSNNNIAKKWYKDKSTSNYVYISDDKIYFNPAIDEVKELIVNGVKEICTNYDVDAIHFDDYFYPTTNKDIDKAEYKKYQKGGGLLTLKKWRRKVVNEMIKSVYSAIKDINKDIQFGISPSGNIDNNMNELYADVKTWVTNDGYVDYICPQIYYGFKNESMPFMFTVKKWIGISDCKIYVGLPLYKSGKADEYASTSNKEAINEFKNNSNIISRQINYLRGLEQIDGFYIFSYSYLFESEDKSISKEVDNIKELL